MRAFGTSDNASRLKVPREDRIPDSITMWCYEGTPTQPLPDTYAPLLGGTREGYPPSRVWQDWTTAFRWYPEGLCINCLHCKHAPPLCLSLEVERVYSNCLEWFTMLWGMSSSTRDLILLWNNKFLQVVSYLQRESQPDFNYMYR